MSILCTPREQVDCTGFVQPAMTRWDKINLSDPLKIGYQNDIGGNADIKGCIEDAAAIWNTGLSCDIVTCVDNVANADYLFIEVDPNQEPRLRTVIGEDIHSNGNSYDIGCLGSCVNETRYDLQTLFNLSGVNKSQIVQLAAQFIGQALGIPRLFDQSANVMAFETIFQGQTEPNQLGAYDIAQRDLRYTCNSNCVIPLQHECVDTECMRWGYLSDGGTFYFGYDDTNAPGNFIFTPVIENIIRDAMTWWNNTVKCDHDIIAFSDDPNLINANIQWNTLDEDVAGNSVTFVGCETHNGTYLLENQPVTGLGTININNLAQVVNLFNTVYTYKDFVEFMAHEIGHSMGIPHPNPIQTHGTMGYNATKTYQHSYYDIDEIRRRVCCSEQNRIVRIPFQGSPSFIPAPCPACRVDNFASLQSRKF